MSWCSITCLNRGSHHSLDTFFWIYSVNTERIFKKVPPKLMGLIHFLLKSQWTNYHWAAEHLSLKDVIENPYLIHDLLKCLMWLIYWGHFNSLNLKHLSLHYIICALSWFLPTHHLRSEQVLSTSVSKLPPVDRAAWCVHSFLKGLKVHLFRQYLG